MTPRYQDLSKALDRGVSSIDISPTMFREATEHYGAIAQLLCSHGVEADIMPYGSFGTGTVVRPSENKGSGSYYDLDILAVCHRKKGWGAPDSLRSEVDGVLRNSDRYADMIEDPSPHCVTIAYADGEGRPAFKLDLSSGVGKPLSADADVLYGEDAVSLAWLSPGRWKGSNPKGLCKWFNDKNTRFRAWGIEARKRRLFERSKDVYNSIEEVPDDLDRSALQRAVQVVKRSRDVFYANADPQEMRTPSSCSLMVLVTNFSETLSSDADIATIVRAFVDGCLAQHGSSLTIPNPVYPENLAAEWSQDMVELFFRWISDLGRNIDVDYLDGARRSAAIDAMLGRGMSARLEKEGVIAASPEPEHIVRPIKPWRA